MKVHAPGDDEGRPAPVGDCGQGQGGHRHRVRIMGVDDVRRQVADHAREAEGGGEVDVMGRGQPDEIVALARAAGQFARRVRHEDGPVAERPETEHRQEDLVLSPAPGAGGVDMERKHVRRQKLESEYRRRGEDTRHGLLILSSVFRLLSAVRPPTVSRTSSPRNNESSSDTIRPGAPSLIPPRRR